MFRHKPDTFYDILGCSPFSTREELTAAYKRSVLAVHPDKVSRLDLAPDEWDRRLAWTKEINRAWETLKDPELRGAYDADMGINNTSPLRRRLGRLRAGLEEEQPASRLRAHLRRSASGTRATPHSPGILARLWTRLCARRDGQWLILFSGALLVHVGASLAMGAHPIPGALRGGLELSLIIALASGLAREGEPTPLFDALSLMLRLNAQIFRLVGALASSWSHKTSHALASGVEQVVTSARNQYNADTAPVDELDAYEPNPAPKPRRR